MAEPLNTDNMTMPDMHAMVQKLVNNVLVRLLADGLIDHATRLEWLKRIGFPLVQDFVGMPSDQLAVCERVFEKMRALHEDGGFDRVEEAYRHKTSGDRVISLIHTAVMRAPACKPRVPSFPVRVRTSHQTFCRVRDS